MLDCCDVDVNSAPDFLGPLHIAAASGNLEIVKCLQSHNVDVDKARSDGATPLFIAAENGHSAVVDRLLLKGANINKAT